MVKKREEIDPDFIARPAQDSALQFPPRHGLRATDEEVSAPAVFDERRIKRDLERLATTPNILAKYITVLRSKFTKASEIKVLNHWIDYYQTAQKIIESRTGVVRAQHKHLQLEREYHIKDREKDLRLTELDADIAEAELRKMRAQYAAYELKQSLNQGSRSYSTVPNTNDPQRVEQWYKQARQGILADHALSVDEQDQLLSALKVEYEQRKRGRFIDI
ncbi:MAG: hypothetical protein ACJ74J_17805 [Blastocatellia bacterium]